MDGQLLILLKSNGASPGDLVIAGTDGTEVIKLPKVTLYSLNPDSTMLVCDSERKMHLLDLKKLNSIQLKRLKLFKYNLTLILESYLILLLF